MTTSVQDAQAGVAAARNAVDEAEGDLLSGKRSVSADVLHKLRDGWRHADLTAQRTRQAAEEERRSARLTGLAAIGAEVGKLARLATRNSSPRPSATSLPPVPGSAPSPTLTTPTSPTWSPRRPT
jgi:hypothetical protein